MKKINIKKAVPTDFDFFFKIKSEKSNIYWTAHNSGPDYLNLQKWFISNLKNLNRKIFMIYYLKEKIGYIYIDTINNHELELSIAITEEHQGEGLGNISIQKVLRIIKNNFDNKEVVAWILDKNYASKKIFINNGFLATNTTKKLYLPLADTNEIMTRYALKDVQE